MTEITQADRDALGNVIKHDSPLLAHAIVDQNTPLDWFKDDLRWALRALATQRVKHEAEIGDCTAYCKRYFKNMAQWRRQARAAEAMLAEAREVIAPFAEAGAALNSGEYHWIERPYDKTVTGDHIRRAAAFMERVGE